jgi:hypothetical protein
MSVANFRVIASVRYDNVHLAVNIFSSDDSLGFFRLRIAHHIWSRDIRCEGAGHHREILQMGDAGNPFWVSLGTVGAPQHRTVAAPLRFPQLCSSK